MAGWKLYWVTDVVTDGTEFCFIIAKTARRAARFHEGEEGLGRGDAHAEAIADMPESAEAAALARLQAWSREHAPQQAARADLHPWPGWARDEVLRAVGAELREHDGTREVIIAGRSFFPSTLEEAWEARLASKATH